MKGFTFRVVPAAFAALLLCVGCSDDGEKSKDFGPDPDSRWGDASYLPDTFRLWSCKTPGKECNAHNSCAVNPVCGSDRRCRPEYLQDCDDKLQCTKNDCLGLGMCDNAPMAGWCALPVKIYPNTKLDSGVPPSDGGGDGSTDATADGATVDGSSSGDASGSGGGSDASADAGTADAKAGDAGPLKTIIHCFKAGARNPNDPCQECRPSNDAGTGSGTRWSSANGGRCDDNNNCTMNDYCQSGVCKGISYASKCADNLSCTDDVCDGKGGCVGNPIKKDYCLINSTCYRKDVKKPSGECKHCDPSVAQKKWTAFTNTCTISGQCYKKGDMDSTKCFVCDPSKSKTAWTKLTGVCSIGGSCYKKGALNPGKCAECDPTVSTTKWTVKGSYCYIDSICRKPGAKDTTKCGVCDPTKDKYKWSTVANTCLINGTCQQKGALNGSKCGLCDPTKSTSSWTQRTSVCKIDGSCYQNGDKNTGGCAECDLKTSTTKWTVKGSNCYIDLACRKPGDKNSTGCGECAPTKDKYKWTAVAGKCLISSVCYSKGDKDPTKCAECAPTTSSSTWTVKGSNCLIKSTCYQPKATNTTKCGECDPTKNKYAWSTIANQCQVHGICHKNGGTHTSSCMTCDTSKDKTAWSPAGSTKLNKYTFESGKAQGWTISAASGGVGWSVVTNRPGAGKYSLYYGNPTKKTYDSGARNTGTAVTPSITLPAGKKAGLSLYLYMDVETVNTHDKLSIYVDKTLVWGKNKPSINVTFKTWQTINVDLSSYAGKTITVTFEFDTTDGLGNTGEGTYIDDLFIYYGC